MKTKMMAIVVLITMAQCVCAQSTDDLRFTGDPSKNTLVTGLKKAVLSAFDKTDNDLALTCFNGVFPVGENTHVVSFSLAVRGITNPPVDKNLERLKESFVPFIDEQKALYDAKGSNKVGITSIGWSSEKFGKGYTAGALPTGQYKLSLSQNGKKETGVFYMKVTFVERKDNHLVVEFSIVAQE